MINSGKHTMFAPDKLVPNSLQPIATSASQVVYRPLTKPSYAVLQALSEVRPSEQLFTRRSMKPPEPKHAAMSTREPDIRPSKVETQPSGTLATPPTRVVQPPSRSAVVSQAP